jgi:hypothetical protein
MEINVEERIRNLESSIAANEKESNRLKRVCLNICLAKEAVEKTLAEVEISSDFTLTEDMQVHFYRYQAPVLLGKWLFFQKCYILESILLSSTGEKRLALLAEELQKAKDFLLEYKGFIQYYFSSDDRLDQSWFTYQSPIGNQLPDNKDELPRQLNQCCRLAGYLLAYLEFAGMLVNLVENNGETDLKAAAGFDLTYQGKIIEIIALGMVIYCAKIFYVNGKHATEKVIFKMLEAATGVPTENFAQRISDLRSKQEPLQTIKQWIKMAETHLGNLPEDRARKKPR